MVKKRREFRLFTIYRSPLTVHLPNACGSVAYGITLCKTPALDGDLRDMAQAYTPGLTVSPRIRWRCRRILPLSGEVLVQPGQRVNAQDVVARTWMPGDVIPINIAKQLGISAGDVAKSLHKKIGEAIAVGEPLAHSPGLFGLFPQDYRSPVAGTVETVSQVTGQVLLRGAPAAVQVLAYLSGTVLELLPKEGCVVEADVAVVQGIFGVGGEAYGPLQVVSRTAGETVTAAQITAKHRGCVVVGSGRLTREAIHRAIECGCAAIVGSGLDDEDLKDLLGYDLGVAVTGSEHLGTTVIVTEGFGEIPMAQRTFELFRQHENAMTSVNGTTQIRAGVMRPEIVIALDGKTTSSSIPGTRPAGALEIGAPVRIIRDPWFGQLGTVAGLPHEPQVLASGSKARVLLVQTANGEKLTVPRANVELIEG